MTFDYHRPSTLEDAWRLLGATPGARFVAGGTDLIVRIKSGVLAPPALVSLRGIPELAAIEVGDEGARIGALATLAQVASHPDLRARWGLLASALQTMGSDQIRNVATLGGNLCNASPCADAAPPLLALEARALIAGPGGRRELPLERFFLGPGATALEPGEVLEALQLEPPSPIARGIFLRKARVRMDLAMVNLAALLQVEGDRCLRARLVAGAVAPTPLRLRAAEAALEGRRITPARIAEARSLAVEAIRPISDLRATAGYRRHIVGVFVKRALVGLAGGRS